MLKKAFSLMVLAIMLLSLVACAPISAPPPAETQTTSPTIQAQPTPEPTPEPSFDYEPILSIDGYPVMDGSTATIPLGAMIMARTAGIPLEEAQNRISFNTTSFAYERLISNSADILVVYEPAKETAELIASSGVELEFHPIGRDALVFIANESNPVESLTTQQLIDIYTGKITNWKELGGNDVEIVPFQRISASGSQALFLKLLMKDTEPMSAPTDLYPSEMGELIEQVAEYNNTSAAIGFSVFYYANYMYSRPGLKFLAVNSVAPSDATLADGTYPFLNDFYAVIRKDAPQDSPERALLEWILSDAGKRTIKDAGYIGIN